MRALRPFIVKVSADTLTINGLNILLNICIQKLQYIIII